MSDPEINGPGISDSKKTRILIVDDEEGMRVSLRRIMIAKGFDVRVAGDGESCLTYAQEFQPHVLLLDIRMPGINGVETFRQLKSICPNAFAVFMTAYASSDLTDDARNEGAVAVLPKPLDIDKLNELISISLRSRPVLIVDDDQGFRNSLERSLRKLGFDVRTAETVDSAVRQFHRCPRSVVIVDMKLNGGSGLDVLEHVQSENSQAPVILMTGLDEMKDNLNTGLAHGAERAFIKPFDIDELVATINAH